MLADATCGSNKMRGTEEPFDKELKLLFPSAVGFLQFSCDQVLASGWTQVAFATANEAVLSSLTT